MKKIAFCIRGGGVKSASAVGILDFLEKKGIKISCYSGTSIGAVISALAATGHSPEEILSTLKEWVIIFSNANRLKGGYGSEIIQTSVNRKCHNIKFKDLEYPLYISANSGGLWKPKEFIFCKENTPDVTLGEACRASASFPVCYERYKVKVNGQKMKFWDGGMAINPFIPRNHAEDVYTICCSFRKNKTNMKSRYKDAWLIPEEVADWTIIPKVGKLGSFGTPDDIETAYQCGKMEMNWLEISNQIPII